MKSIPDPIDERHRQMGGDPMSGTTTAERAWAANVAADYRDAGNAELHADIESLRYDLAAADQFGPTAADVVRSLAGGRLKLAEAELARRERLHAAGGNVPNPHAASYRQWRHLARDIRERADMLALFATAGVQLRRDGREFSAPCPLCGGADRFRVWPAEDGRRPGYWCRRCGISGDAIAAYRSFLMPGASFFDAVRVMALQLELGTPDHGTVKNGSQTGLGTIRKNGSSTRENSSQGRAPLREKRFGNHPRRPAIRFDHGRAVAS